MRLKYYELHQTPNERQKAKLIFCRCPHDLRPHHHGKKRKDASTDSGLGASAQTLVLRRIILKNYDLPEIWSLAKMSKNWSPVITSILFVKSKVLPVCKLLLRYRDHSHCKKSPKSVAKSQSIFFKP